MTSLQRGSGSPAHLRVILGITSRCTGKCIDCFDRRGHVDLSRRVLERNVIPFFGMRFGGVKPSGTLLGGEGCLHRGFLPIVEGMAASEPENLDIYTNGQLFKAGASQLFGILNKKRGNFSIVYSFDRHHVHGVKWTGFHLAAAFRDMHLQWGNGSQVGFVISSTRFTQESEPEIEAAIHRLAAENCVPIKTGVLSWEAVFKWAKAHPLRVILPKFGASFDFVARENGRIISEGRKLVFVFESGMICGSVQPIKDHILRQLGNYQAAKYPFKVKLEREGTIRRGVNTNAVEMRYFVGTKKEEIGNRRFYPANQVYIAPTGEVYENPIALSQGKGTGYSVNEMPLVEIVRRIHGIRPDK